MNETSPTEARPRWFRPRTFLLGLGIGLLACALAGRYAAQHDYHAGFTRFHPRISPEAHYYPTVDEMGSVVRARCRPGQILVIVGGNSILYGVGQPADRLWTVELQRQLGDRYAVVNLAMRGAFATDGGAVIAEVLRKEFPRQVYVANMAPLGDLEPLGLDDYRFIFWEAQHRGLLEDFGPRTEFVSDFWRQHAYAERFAQAGQACLDTALRYRDLWNWVGYRHFFTISTFYTPRWPELAWPRERLRDEEGDLEQMPFYSPSRFSKENEAAEMAITRGFTGSFYLRDARGHWALRPPRRMRFMDRAAAAFPDTLKRRTLLLVSRNSPFYLKKLTADERRRDDLGYRDTIALLGSLGYGAMDYGRDYAETEFADRTHLTASGGRRLAAQVARRVEEMAKKLGY